MTNILIINGGTPLEGCPKDQPEANSIIEFLNEERPDYGPQWSFDCGFKLDYDGGILTICSRFYPPKSHYGETWDGSVTVYIMDDVVSEKEFDCKSIQQLKKEVEDYVQLQIEKVKLAFQ